MLRHDPFKRLMALKPPDPAMQSWWQQVAAEMALVAGFAYDKQTEVMTVPEETDIEGRTGEPVKDIIQRIGADGTGIDSRLLPISKTGNLGSAISPSPLTASDAGSDATITIAAFTPQFDFGTLSVSGGSITGLAYSTQYFVYLTNFSYANGSYTAALATTSILTLASNPTYFYIGTVTTPANGGPPAGGGGGGGFFEP